MGAAVLAAMGMTSCVGDLDQLPKDPSSTQPTTFNENPKEYIGGAMAKCYSSLAVSGQYGPNGDADIKGLDGGTSQYTRALFMLEEFPTDECLWMYDDGGVDEMRWGTWGSANVAIFGTYSRLYTHIAVCNEFLRLTTPSGLSDNGINVDAATQKEIDQFRLEARALRDLSYYYVIDLFGNAVYAWDNMKYGEVPQQMTRKELFDNVTADLEDVLAKFPDTTPVWGRIGKDAVEALLTKYYLNAEVYTGTAQWDKCWAHCQNIISRHQGSGFEQSGLAKDYLSLFCATNKMFTPGGGDPSQNEILWAIPQHNTYTEPYGGATFLINGALKAMAADIYNPTAGFMDTYWFGSSDGWGCMFARPELTAKFDFAGGESRDGRTYLWQTEKAGFTSTAVPYNQYGSGYPCIKFTALQCEADGTMPKWQDPQNGLNRAGVHTLTKLKNWNNSGDSIRNGEVVYQASVPNCTYWHDTNVPVIRLAEVYLTAAECALHGAGNQSDALRYVNYLRSRAGVKAWTGSDLTLANLLDERARELYWELNRRTDLIRHDKFISGYTWAWKGGVQNGTAFPSHYNLYPIPADVLATYGSSMKQNPGY